ncbi:MAG: hypothetical protein FWE15_08505 [Actinomycetia bacterium]|nr:hypothetical protein [Actinomycetes bacterium]
MNALSHHGAARSGTEPTTARSATGLRLRLSLIWAPIFLVLCGLLAWGAAETQTGDTQTVVIALSTACFLAFCFALGDALRLIMGRRHEGRPRPSA